MAANLRQFRQRGFTLVELLTVMAVLAILVAMLLPGLRKAREQAYAVRCISNLGQVNLSLRLYMVDFGMTLPEGTSYFHGHGRSWVDFLIGPKSDITKKTYASNSEVLHCPKNNAKSPGYYGGINIQHDGETGTGPQIEFTVTTSESTPVWKPFTGMRVSKVDRPSDYALIADTAMYSNGVFDTGASGFFVDRTNSGSNFSAASLWMAHGNFVNILFVDGHTEMCDQTRLMHTANSNYNGSSSRERQGISCWKDQNFAVQKITLP